MPIKVTCTNPDCGRSYPVKDELKGKKIRCPGCKAILTVGEVRPPKPPGKIKFNCSFCHKTIVALETAAGKKILCPECRRELVIPRLSQELLLDVVPREQKAVKKRVIVCPQCGRVLPGGITRCSDCGFSIISADVRRMVKDERKPTRWDFFLYGKGESFSITASVLLLASFLLPLGAGVAGGLKGFLFFWMATSGAIPYRVLLFYPVAACVLAIALAASSQLVKGIGVLIIGAIAFIMMAALDPALVSGALPEGAKTFLASAGPLWGVGAILLLLTALGQGVVIAGSQVVAKVRAARLRAYRLTVGLAGLVILVSLLVPIGAAGGKKVLAVWLFSAGPLFAVVAVFLFAFAGLGLLRFASLPAWVNRYLEVSTPFAALGTWALALVGIIIAAADVPNVGPLVGLGLGLRSTAPALLIWAGAMLVVAKFLITKVKKPAGPAVMEPKF